MSSNDKLDGMRLTGLAAGITALIAGCSPEGDEAKAKMAKLQEQIEEKSRYLGLTEKAGQNRWELESPPQRERSPLRLYDDGITPDWSDTEHACPECHGTGKGGGGKCWNCKGTGFSFEPSPPRPIKARPTRAMDR